MRRITEDEIRAMISEEQIRGALERHAEALRQAAADEYARILVANAPDRHVTLPGGGPHPGCACANCCQQRLGEMLAKISSITERLHAAQGKPQETGIRRRPDAGARRRSV